MSKLDINNEIVLMRHTVRRARLHVVRKLIKQVKMLGLKKGDDKQREKYKRKADKLGQELAAIKKLKDDEISRYSITNTRGSADVLTDKNSDPETCVLARLSSLKILADRVAEFKTKFPNFEEHLGPGRRKLIKLKRKAGKQAKKEAKLNAKTSEQEETQDGDLGSDDNGSVESGEEIERGLDDEEENCEDPKPELPEKKTETKRKVDDSFSENKRVKPEPKVSAGLKPREIKPRKHVEKLAKQSGMTLSNKEAAVKSFAQFLEEGDGGAGRADEESKGDNEIVLEKEVDSFFMTEDGGREYLSVVVPKSNVTEEEEEEGDDSRSFRSRNNRFFDKVDDGVERRWQNGKRDNGNFSRAASRSKEGKESWERNNTGKNLAKNRGGDYRGVEKPTNESMHPSWAAKKKEQEILKLGFQGKKIVFDDV